MPTATSSISRTAFRFVASGIRLFLRIWLLAHSPLFQNFLPEIDQLENVYAPNELCGYFVQKQMVGVIGIQEMDANTIELKRFFLTKAYQGNGIGSRFFEQVLQLEQVRQYSKVRLKTYDFMQTGIRIYQKLGFVEIRSSTYLMLLMQFINITLTRRDMPWRGLKDIRSSVGHRIVSLCENLTLECPTDDSRSYTNY